MSLRLFYDPQSCYISNQSGSTKETVSPKIGENIEMLVCFICRGTQDGTLIDINHYYQIAIINIKNWTWKLNMNIHKVAFLLYQLLIFLNLFFVYLFRQSGCRKKSFSPRAARDGIFYFTRPLDRKHTTFWVWPYSRGRPTCYSDRLPDFSVTICKCYKDVYANSFFPGTDRLWY